MVDKNKIKEYQKTDKYKQYKKEYYQKNKKKLIEYQKQYQKENYVPKKCHKKFTYVKMAILT